MKQAQKPGKRIVSKSDYALFRARKAGLNMSIAGGCGFAFLFIGIGVCFLFAFLSIMLGMAVEIWRDGHVLAEEGKASLTLLAGSILFGAGAYALGKIAERSIDKSAQTEDVLPLTRANAADLPAPESLVRASAEPAQAQETVLLRAAGDMQEKHEEQLLRAATRGHERTL